MLYHPLKEITDVLNKTRVTYPYRQSLSLCNGGISSYSQDLSEPGQNVQISSHKLLQSFPEFHGAAVRTHDQLRTDVFTARKTEHMLAVCMFVVQTTEP